MENRGDIQLAQELEFWFAKQEKVVIALSGGIDSTLVAYAARKVLGRENALAIISASTSVKEKELKDARDFCLEYDIELKEIDAREIDDDNYRSNPINRCFFCKSALYSALEKLVAKEYKGFTVLNGNNFSDFGDYRPGLQAAEDYKVASPLAECKFTKIDIRSLAQFYGIQLWNKPASPCLSSRFPYGETISVDKLRMVENAENLVNRFGFEDVRVRYVNNMARIEVPVHQIGQLQKVFDEINPEIKSFGFDTCEIDPEGLISGKLNRNLTIK